MAGRKSVYETKIKPRFNDIAEWVKQGATEKSIAQNLGVGYSTFNNWKSKKEELAELLENNRAAAVEEIENAMFESALGGIKTIKKAMKIKTVEYKNGKRVKEWEEVVTYDEQVYLPPNTTAGIYLLKHWAKNKGYTNDPLLFELKKKELQLKERQINENNW